MFVNQRQAGWHKIKSRWPSASLLLFLRWAMDRVFSSCKPWNACALVMLLAPLICTLFSVSNQLVSFKADCKTTSRPASQSQQLSVGHYVPLEGRIRNRSRLDFPWSSVWSGAVVRLWRSHITTVITAPEWGIRCRYTLSADSCRG